MQSRAAALISRIRSGQSEDIDGRLASEFGRRALASFHVHAKVFPSYRFVDLFKAANEYFAGRHNVATIESQHDEDLNNLLHGKRPQWASRRIKGGPSLAWPIGPGEEIYLPVDGFWLCATRSAEGRDRVVVRLRYEQNQDVAVLEVAAEDGAAGEAILRRLDGRSVERSLYRNRLLEFVAEAGVMDEYGNLVRMGAPKLRFKVEEIVDDKDIVIDDEVLRILWRNVIDLHRRRDVLKAHHVPVRRGVLLYGPPGTGKTFACRYLCGKLPDVTRIVVTGTAMLQVNTVFALARLLQPSLVIFEDVVLIFASREINLYSSVLGDLLDQMDGLRPYEDIGFILTTNAIDRMEAAIKDRPGRISQCLYFGAPKPELRRRYLLHYLRHYETTGLDMDKLVVDSDGATPAFLKEWVHRSVQIALERVNGLAQRVGLSNEDFRHAMSEMRKFSEGSTGRIIGFHVR